MQSLPRRPSGWYYLLAVVGLPLLGGAISIAALFAWLLPDIEARVAAMPRVVVPGQATVHLDAGPQTVFYEWRSLVDGRAMAGNEVLYGVFCGMAGPDGKAVQLEAGGATFSYQFDSFIGTSLYDFQAPTAGDYTIGCESKATGQLPIVLAFGSGLGKTVVLAMIPAGLGLLSGLVLFVIVYVRRRRPPAPELPTARIA